MFVCFVCSQSVRPCIVFALVLSNRYLKSVNIYTSTSAQLQRKMTATDILHAGKPFTSMFFLAWHSTDWQIWKLKFQIMQESKSTQPKALRSSYNFQQMVHWCSFCISPSCSMELHPKIYRSRLSLDLEKWKSHLALTIRDRNKPEPFSGNR